MRIRFLGTGSGNPNPDRMTSSALIEGSEGALLLDAGEGCARRLVEADHWSQPVRSVLITHRHADHHAGLPMLLNGYKHRRREPLEILAAAPLLEALQGWLKTLHLGSDDMAFELTWRAIQPGEFTPASGHQGELWLTDHLPISDLGGCHGLTLELGGERWVFSSDIKSPDTLTSHLPGATGLVVEGWHVEPVEVVALAQKLGVARVYLTHVTHGQPTPDLPGAQWVHDNMMINTGDGDE